MGNLVQEYLAKLNAIKVHVLYSLVLNFIQPKISERDNLHLDYDKWRNTVKTYQDKPPKDPSKVQQVFISSNFRK